MINFSKNVFFIPYKGSKYEQGYKNKRILVLGESHYCADDDGCTDIEKYPEWESLTNNVIQSLKDYQQGNIKHIRWMNTFTQFAKAFNNGEMSSEEIIDFWERVVFYNYVQVPTISPGVSPSKEDFTNSEKGFWEVLEAYEPDIIIAWSERLWTNMPDNGEYRKKDNTTINNGKGLYYYKVKNKEIPAMYVVHPSRIHYEIVYNQLKEVFDL